MQVFKILIISLFLAACSAPKKPAPVEDFEQPPSRNIDTHIVAPGETLYSIAYRYGLDYRKLAKANEIDADFNIYPGQLLYLRNAPVRIANNQASLEPSATSVPSSRPSPTGSVKKPSVTRSNPLTSPTASNKKRSQTKTAVTWVWPAPGPVTNEYVPGRRDAEGIDIGVKKGESVFAAADGTVVYAGEGLRGYGKLLIIQHSKQFLSAYAHADKILVEEGRTVQAGQKVAEIGSIGTEKAKLYFEIRKAGKPVNPAKYLPKR